MTCRNPKRWSVVVLLIREGGWGGWGGGEGGANGVAMNFVNGKPC